MKWKNEICFVFISTDRGVWSTHFNGCLFLITDILFIFRIDCVKWDSQANCHDLSEWLKWWIHIWMTKTKIKKKRIKPRTKVTWMETIARDRPPLDFREIPFRMNFALKSILRMDKCVNGNNYLKNYFAY